jgi:hypothetical protein
MMPWIGWAPIEDAKGASMSTKLTDTQLVLLGAAAQRKDLCLVAPPTGLLVPSPDRITGLGLDLFYKASGDQLTRYFPRCGALAQ